MDKTLVIMAAGLGSRYGGDKQIDGMGPHNEVLMAYSIYDAIRAGFTKVIFIIKHSFEERFKLLVGDVVKSKIKVEYAFQEMNDLPEGCKVDPQRTKPLGTVHALLSARDLVKEPFAVINADDYYGPDAYISMAKYLDELRDEKHGCMIGYYLKNTISDHGHVTRGICGVSDSGILTSVTETYKIQPFPDGTIRDTEKDPNGTILDPDCLVSMNFFGFTPWLFDKAASRLRDFINAIPQGDLKSEYVLPTLVDQLMHEEGLAIDVLSTDSVWFGVTYHEDKAYVQAALLELHKNGTYPEYLF